MAFNQPHMLLAWSGHFVGQGDVVVDDFAGSLRFVGPGSDNVQTEERLLALAQTLGTFWASPYNGIPDSAVLDHVKWNRIGVDGRYADANNTLEMTLPTPRRGALTATSPTQIACCTTWTTDFTRGRASKGRTFWPSNWNVSQATQLRISPTNQQSMANWAINLIVALNKAASGAGPTTTVPTGLTTVSGDPATVVAAVMSDIGEGRSSIINGVRVGDRLDIQRRRGGRIAEKYLSVSFP